MGVKMVLNIMDLKIKIDFEKTTKLLNGSLKKHFYLYGNYLSDMFSSLKPINRVEWLWSLTSGSIKNAYANGYKAGYTHALKRLKDKE